MHKSQGQTFDYVDLHFGFGAFAHGQAYVAFSRCRTLEGIKLLRKLEARDIILDAVVVDFLREYLKEQDSKDTTKMF
jgi:ATP-dependent exoDNAse (exonuclease V) alpha subunit